MRGMFFTNEQKHVKTDFLPQYMLVANDIIKKIFDGEYRPASKLPSMRFLAKKYGVSVQVILSALQKHRLRVSGKTPHNSKPEVPAEPRGSPGR